MKQSFRVLSGLSYPTDPAVIRRLLAGDQVPLAERNLKRAEPGAIVNDIPAVSLPWLVEQGLIEPVPVRTELSVQKEDPHGEDAR